MKKTFAVLLLGGSLFSLLFSSCSSTGIAFPSSAGNSLSAHGAHRNGTVEDATDSSDSPDSFGNPLVEF
jgi:hypothetical protein